MAENVEIVIKGNSTEAVAAIESVNRSVTTMGTTTQKAAHDSGNYLKELGSHFTSMATAALAAGVVAEKLVEFIVDSAKEAMEAEQNMAQLEAVIKSTGGAAGVTAQYAEELAGAYSQVSTYSRDAIISSENILLTFTNINKNVFPQTIQAITDISTAMKVDLKTSAEQLGKALNDPIKGMTTLRRMGVQFSATQQQQIRDFMKVNDVASAQGIILDKIAEKYGGSAAAAANTFGGELTRLKNRTTELQEAMGKALIDGIKPTLDELLKFSESADGMKAAQKAGELLVVVFDVLKLAVMNVVNMIGIYKDGVTLLIETVKHPLADHKKQWQDIGDQIKNSFIDAGKNAKKVIDDTIKLFDDAGKKITTTVETVETKGNDSFQQLETDAQYWADAIEKDFEQALKRTEASFKLSFSVMGDVSGAFFKTVIDSNGDMGKVWNEVLASMVEGFGKLISGELMALAAMEMAKGIAALASVVEAGLAPGYFVAAGMLTAASGAVTGLASGAAGMIRSSTTSSHADGGYVDEPVRGIGMNSGRQYSFGENGREQVIPSGSGGAGSIAIQTLIIQPANFDDFIIQLQQRTGTRLLRR